MLSLLGSLAALVPSPRPGSGLAPRVVFTDCDGTMLQPDHTLSPAATAMLHTLHRDTVKVAWLTAFTHHFRRPAAWVPKRACAGALVSAQRHRFHRLRPCRHSRGVRVVPSTGRARAGPWTETVLAAHPVLQCGSPGVYINGCSAFTEDGEALASTYLPDAVRCAMHTPCTLRRAQRTAPGSASPESSPKPYP